MQPRLALLLALCSFGCAASKPAAPLRYPTLAAQPASAHEPSFQPDAALSALPLSCSASESALENALDDDCDGQIDGQPGAALGLALAYARATPLELALKSAEGTRIALPPAACAESAPFCANHLALESVERGDYTLIATRADESPEASATALVSVRSHGKVTTYLAQIAGEERERVLGRLTLP